MKIIGIEAVAVEMPLAEPYRIAYETVTSATNVFFRVDTSGGITGFGCAAPDPYITGETPEAVLQAADSLLDRRLRGANPLRIGAEGGRALGCLENPQAAARPRSCEQHRSTGVEGLGDPGSGLGNAFPAAMGGVEAAPIFFQEQRDRLYTRQRVEPFAGGVRGLGRERAPPSHRHRPRTPPRP